jgi:Flp pilus assembly protein TadB
MTLALLSGLGVGLGLCLLLVGLRPPPRTLSATLQRLDSVPPQPATAPAPQGALLPRLLASLGVRSSHVAGNGVLAGLTGDLAPDLAVTATPAEVHAGIKTLSAIAGLLTPVGLSLLVSLLGLHLPLLVPPWVSLTGALVGYLLPDLRLRHRAAEARRSFRASVGAYLDLVAMRMASGSGLAEALHEAARIGTGPAFAQVRGALADARTDGLTPAQALGHLGQQLQLSDLVETSSRLRLVDSSGAQAELSLRAQAASLRDRELADAQGRANEQSQSMLVAQVVLGLGFVLFLGYPAVIRVLAT